MAKRKVVDHQPARRAGKLVYFCSQLTEENKKALRKYAAEHDQKLYEALNEVIKKGLQR